MCYGGLFSLNCDDMWDLFKSLVSYQWQSDCASEPFMCPFPPPYSLHAQSSCVNELRDLCHHSSSYPLGVCSYYQFFDHNLNFCPYYDVFDESYIRLNDMIETMNEQRKCFVGTMREFGLLHETNSSLPFSELKASLYEYCQSLLPLESNFVDNVPLTNLEETFDLPLTSWPFVIPFSFSTSIVITLP